MNCEVATGKGSVSYVTSKRVPVIGSATGEPWFYQSPMYFPQASNADQAWFANLNILAGLMRPDGKTKLGIIFCAEAPTCADGERVFADRAQSFGLQLAYKAKVSVAQPDFTAECLAAQRAGVEVLFHINDANSVRRIMTSCTRQGFKPIQAPNGQATRDDFKALPEADRLISASPVFPYFQHGTPATDEFQGALQTYGGGKVGGAFAIGWVAGKLLEKAAANLPEPPTSAALLAGLWRLKGDDLGGLTMPLTFTENQVATPMACAWAWGIKGGQWTSPDGFKRICTDEPYPVK